jgi:ferric-dicitrate binding protein FerR (iron transport regulator)
MNAKHNPDWSPEFWRIVECASDEPIAPADAEAFAEILAESPEAQRDYLAHIQLQADLHLLSASQQSLDKALARLETIVHPAEEPVLTKSSARFWIYGSLLGTAATVLLSLWLTRPVTNTSTGITRISGPQTVIPHTNVRKIKLDSGSVQMELDNVGTVVVAGPADFELLGNQRARLNSGRINLKVPE